LKFSLKENSPGDFVLSSSIVFKKSVGTSGVFLATESMNFFDRLCSLFPFGVGWDVVLLSSTLDFLTYRETFSTLGFLPSSRIRRFFSSSGEDEDECPGGVFFLQVNQFK